MGKLPLNTTGFEPINPKNKGENSCTKAQLELKLVRNVGVNENSFFKYINGSRQHRNIIGPLQEEDGHLTNSDRDKAEVFNAFFACVFNTDDGPRGSQWPELEGHDCENDQLPVNPEIVQDMLLQLDPYKSMGLDGIHLKMLKELADAITKPLLIILELSWESGEVPADWKLTNVAPVFKKGKKEDPRNYRPVSLTKVPDKATEKIGLGNFEKHLKDKNYHQSQSAQLHERKVLHMKPDFLL
ncbi:hypothetical protein WISP_138422 [Willisornis vidua]|uniref:Rna-directed dna polymerase from mobile element jockey-like n=1 Tax=Willisornis vidua TaxID=1566151 RepID=A0ABQ9CMY0_9PASS|nr:hypothetical protein WISP_138422 [Willisornis vidua]